MFVRIYSGDDGESHFEELELPEVEAETVPLKAGANMTFRRAVKGHSSNWHPGPRRQYVIIMRGHMDVGIGDGSTRRFGPGDIMLVEDLTGRGHDTQIVGGTCNSVIIPVEG